MTKEQLEKGKAIEEKIKAISKDRDIAQNLLSRSEYFGLNLYQSGNYYTLRDECCPISPRDFLALYVAKANTMIAELETELKNL